MLIYGHWGAPNGRVRCGLPSELGGICVGLVVFLCSIPGVARLEGLAARSVHPHLAHQRNLFKHALSSVAQFTMLAIVSRSRRCWRQCTLAAVGIEQLCRRWVCPRPKRSAIARERRYAEARQMAGRLSAGDGYWRLWLDFSLYPRALAGLFTDTEG